MNYIDVYIRKGLYRMIEPPAPIGMEAAGVVVESNAPGFSPGDRVAYACPPPGAYVTMRTLPAEHLVLLPDHVSEETAAALMLKGMTAEYLLHRTHRVRPGDTVLVHAAAGGVGLLLCQWARALGARVVGTVSSEAKAELAHANGCEHPIVTRTYAFAERTKQVSGGRGADVIYDGLGRRGGGGEPGGARHARPLGELRAGDRRPRPREPEPRSREPSPSRCSSTTPRTTCSRWRAACSPPCVTASSSPRSATAIPSPPRPTRIAISRRDAPAARSCCSPDRL